MKIRAQIASYFVGRPVWTAVDDDTYDGEGSPIGLGSTREGAIEDLMWQLEDKGLIQPEEEEEGGQIASLFSCIYLFDMPNGHGSVAHQITD